MCASTAALVDVDLARAPATTAFSLFCSVCFTFLTLKVQITYKNAYDIASLSIAAEERGCHLPESLAVLLLLSDVLYKS